MSIADITLADLQREARERRIERRLGRRMTPSEALRARYAVECPHRDESRRYWRSMGKPLLVLGRGTTWANLGFKWSNQ